MGSCLRWSVGVRNKCEDCVPGPLRDVFAQLSFEREIRTELTTFNRNAAPKTRRLVWPRISRKYKIDQLELTKNDMFSTSGYPTALPSSEVANMLPARRAW